MLSKELAGFRSSRPINLANVNFRVNGDVSRSARLSCHFCSLFFGLLFWNKA
jgi:hypothetical protein